MSLPPLFLTAPAPYGASRDISDQGMHGLPRCGADGAEDSNTPQAFYPGDSRASWRSRRFGWAAVPDPDTGKFRTFLMPPPHPETASHSAAPPRNTPAEDSTRTAAGWDTGSFGSKMDRYPDSLSDGSPCSSGSFSCTCGIASKICRVCWAET